MKINKSLLLTTDMKRFYKFAVHCILTFVFVLTSVEVFSQGIVGTTSANGVRILYQENFPANPFDLTAPIDTDKWTKTNESGAPGAPTYVSTANSWQTGFSGYDSGTSGHIQQNVPTTAGAYLWTPVYNLPDSNNLFARLSLRVNSWVYASGTFTISMVFDGDGNLTPDASPTPITLTQTGAGSYNDLSSFFLSGSDFTRLIYFDLTTFKNRTGRLGILLKHSGMTSAVDYKLDWFLVGTRPTNDLCGNAYTLVNGLNGGTNGFYNSTASGVTPTLNSTPNGRAGGSTAYVGAGTNGLGSIPTDGTVLDGYDPVLTSSNPGVFSLAAHKVENTTWYKFTTPPNPTDCGQPAGSSLTVRIILRDLACVRNSTNISSNLQARVFPASVCGTSTQADNVDITLTTSPWANNGTINATGLSYNTTYVLVVDGMNGNDCRFKLETETLINGVSQPTAPCTILPITLKDFTATPEEDGTVSLNWATLSERNNDFFTVERSTDGVNYVEIHKQAGAGNSTTEQVYGAVDFLPEAGLNYYRLKQTDFDGNFEYFDPIAVNVIPSMLNMTLIPNPTSRDASVLLSSRSRQHIQLQVYDITGKFLFLVEDYINEGNTSFSLPSEKWNSGTYLVRVVTDKETITEKLIVNL